MKKYWEVVKIAWQNGFVYRTSLLLWRLRQVLSTIMALTLWTALLGNTGSGFGYTQSQMVTYIFSISILNGFILATSLQGLGSIIYSGQLSFYLLRPVNIFLYFASQEVADKLKNVSFVIMETILLYLLFRPEIVLPDLPHGILFLIWAFAGAVLHYLIQLLFGSLGFWSPETWGVRFLFFMFLNFTAGKLFPLDILPKILQKIIFFTPFPYLSFLQIQLLLNKLSTSEILIYSFWFLFWIFALALIVRHVWKKGLKDYAAAGQ